LAIWPTCRGPWRPAASDLAVAPSSTPGSPKSNACPARSRRTSPRHILGPAPLRAFYSVPSGAGVRADHAVPCPATKRAAVLLIETDSKSLIGPKYPQQDHHPRNPKHRRHVHAGPTERTPQSVNEKQLFARNERRAVDNPSRCDKTSLELFLSGIAGWGAGLGRRVAAVAERSSRSAGES